ncbi:MAG: hypothetical protein U9R37_06720 [Campylobacterota bacterium]|nr:hypothetical protein [Campylobacterota bacterium]
MLENKLKVGVIVKLKSEESPSMVINKELFIIKAQIDKLLKENKDNLELVKQEIKNKFKETSSYSSHYALILYLLYSDSKASKVVAFVDSCFSGATDGKSVIKGVAASRLVPKKVTFNKSKMVVLTAGKDKQYSNMYEEKGHRLFSYFVMKSLLKGKTNINDIYREVYTNIKDESYKMDDMKIQEPTIDGNLKLKL